MLLNLLLHIAKSSFATHYPVLNIPLLSKLYPTLYITNIILHLHLFNFTFSIPINDCAKQHNLRQFSLLNVKQCTEAPPDSKHASVKARVYVGAKS